MTELFTVIGFILAGYSVIANDSVQTLGTWIASNREKFKWTTLWAKLSMPREIMSFTQTRFSFSALTTVVYKKVAVSQLSLLRPSASSRCAAHGSSSVGVYTSGYNWPMRGEKATLWEVQLYFLKD